jgi:hypothetical protein
MQANYCLCLLSSETVSLCLPLALRLAKTFLPLAEAILALKPCLFLLFLCEGWNVLFMIYILSYNSDLQKGLQR